MSIVLYALALVIALAIHPTLVGVVAVWWLVEQELVA